MQTPGLGSMTLYSSPANYAVPRYIDRLAADSFLMQYTSGLRNLLIIEPNG